MDLSKQEVHHMSTRGQKRSREETTLHAPWSRAEGPASSFSRSQTWEAPGFRLPQAHQVLLCKPEEASILLWDAALCQDVT